MKTKRKKISKSKIYLATIKQLNGEINKLSNDLSEIKQLKESEIIDYFTRKYPMAKMMKNFNSIAGKVYSGNAIVTSLSISCNSNFSKKAEITIEYEGDLV